MKNDSPVVVGYVRLSRDDHKKNYVSIENQKQKIQNYAWQKGWNVKQWYEDDGFSGYSFQRPAFQKMLQSLDFDIMIAKDLSRIGRHNARVLLFLEEIAQMGKRLILIDDHYDTTQEENEMIGIKTWYNERYVKETSRKIKSIMRMKQIEGTLATGVPFGYRREKDGKREIRIEESHAETVQMIFQLYLSGMGFRLISVRLNEKKIPTPSMAEKQRAFLEGRPCRKKEAAVWSPAMVGDILKNDFYAGTLRHHKRERICINGKERRIKKEEQIIFENNHPAIIDPELFCRVQTILQERKQNCYRGEKEGTNRFSGLLLCKDCGKKMTGITRGDKRYFVCSTYNKKGNAFCKGSHMVYEEQLEEAIFCYFHNWMDQNKEKLEQIKKTLLDQSGNSKRLEKIKNRLAVQKQEVKKWMIQRMKEETSLNTKKELLEELEKEKWNEIQETEQRLQLEEKRIKHKESDYQMNTMQFYQKFLFHQKLEKEDLKNLIDKIVVEKDGSFFLYFK